MYKHRSTRLTNLTQAMHTYKMKNKNKTKQLQNMHM